MRTPVRLRSASGATTTCSVCFSRRWRSWTCHAARERCRPRRRAPRSRRSRRRRPPLRSPPRASLLRGVSNDPLPTLASLAALQPAPHVEKEALCLQAIPGPTSVHPPTVTWEGQRYTVDLAATTFRRLVRVRREQQELSLD